MSITSLEGFPGTAIYHKKPIVSSKANTPLCMMIPGNPGLVDFYTTYLDLIQEAYPRFEIVCVSHRGYLEQNQPFSYQDLDAQIEHKYDIIRKLVLERDGVDLYFFAHSMGSYVLQRTLKKLLADTELVPRFEVKFCGLICPTVYDIAVSPSGIKFVRLLSWLPLVSVVTLVVHMLRSLLSESIVRTIIAKYVVAKPKLQDQKSLESWQNSVNGCFNLFNSNSIVKQAMMMGEQEMSDIKRDDLTNDWFFGPPGPNTKIWSFFAREDHWVHENTRDYLLKRHYDENNDRVVFDVDDLDVGITHSFCVDQSVEFSKITIDMLARLFPELK